MALADRFLKEARIGEQVDLITGPKEIVGKIMSLDAETVGIKKQDGKTAVIDLSTITYFELFTEEETQAAAEIPEDAVKVNSMEETTVPVEPMIETEEEKFVEQLEKPECNVLEEAMIACDISTMEELLADGLLMEELGYTEQQVERIKKVIQVSVFPKKSDFYNIAGRVDCFEDNKNGIADYYYRMSLTENPAESVIGTKAIRKLVGYVVLQKDYEKYYDIYERFPNQVDLTKMTTLLFHVSALNRFGKDGMALLREHSLLLSAEADYNLLLYFLLENQEDTVAERLLRIVQERKLLKGSELILRYLLKYRPREEFEAYRKILFVNLYSLAPLSSLVLLMNVGYEVEETTKFDQKNTEEETEQGRSLEDVQKAIMEDSLLGPFRLVELWKRMDMVPEDLAEQFEDIHDRAQEDWKVALEQEDVVGMKYVYYLNVITQLPESKLAQFRTFFHEDCENEILELLIHFDQAKLTKLMFDTSGMLGRGYSEQEVERYGKIFNTGAFSTGNSSYEIASRLHAWGFAKQAAKYYIEVIQNPESDKYKSALNQIVAIASHTKDYEMFETYYELLDEKQKKNELYLRFMTECNYKHGEYEKLYEIYKNERTSTVPGVIYGAISYENCEEEIREELLEKIYAFNYFDFDFWKGYLTERIQVSLEEYRSILAKLLDEQTIKAVARIEKLIEIIRLDPKFAGEITEDVVRKALQENFPLALVLVLSRECLEPSEEFKDYLLEKIVSSLYSSIEEMEYRRAHSVAQLAIRYYPEDEDLSKIFRISANGIDVYNMLPSGQDNYAKGKRLLLLGENLDRAFECFEKEIGTSEDEKTIALCGLELLKGLYEAERYEEVISWGRVLLIDKGINQYSALALDIHNAFEKVDSEEEKQEFLKDLSQKAEEAMQSGHFEQATEQIKLVEILDKEAPLVLEYKELLDKMRDENINLKEDTFIGQANIYRYVENDNEKYINFLKEGFAKGSIEAGSRNAAAVMFLEAIIHEEKIMENMDFVDHIAEYGISMSEHVVEMLYSIVISYKNMNSAIEYFTALYEGSEPDKKLAVLIRLEKIYENALRNEVDFDASHAVEQMLEYTKQNLSLQAKLCYIWVLAYAGQVHEAGELLALIPEDMQLTEEQEQIVEMIVNRYFEGSRPELIERFNSRIREITFLRFVEYSRTYKDFIAFSPQEEKIHAELLKNSAYKVDVNSETVRTALIKSIYEMPTKYKFWYLYFLCIRSTADPALLYCVNNCMVILNTDANSDISEKQAAYMLKTNQDLAANYGPYKLYNKLYRMYLMKAYKKNVNILNQISALATDKKLFAANPAIRKKLAEDYIHLLKLLDDRDDYIYIKSAMFIATNNHCEEYFYKLFRNDLLYREPIICIKMCQEMIIDKRGKEAINIQALNELREANQEHAGVVDLFLSDHEQLEGICRLLQNYPSLPKEDKINEYFKKNGTPEEDQIAILEEIDKCYSQALIIKKYLMTLYRNSKNLDYYEKMYRTILWILKSATSEELLYDSCRLAGLIAAALGKQNRTSDILSMYDKQSLDRIYSRELSEFCEICDALAESDDERISRMIQALIADDWMEFLAEYGVDFIAKIPGIKPLIGFSKMPFVQAGVSYLLLLESMEREEESRQFSEDLDICVQIICGKSIKEEIKLLSDLPKEEQQELVNSMLLTGEIAYKLPEKEDFLMLLIRIWDIVYERKELLSMVKGYRSTAVGFRLFYRLLLRFYEDAELMRTYTERLYDERRFGEIVALQEEFEWVKEDFFYATYAAVALLLSGEVQAYDLLAEMNGERFVNVILLLKKQMLGEELQKIALHVEGKKDITNLILEMIANVTEEHLELIGREYDGEDEIALMKLAYCRSDDEGLQLRMTDKYGETIKSNQYIVLWKKTNSGPKIADDFYFKAGDESQMGEAVAGLEIRDCVFVKEAMAEISLEGLNEKPFAEEKKRLEDAYFSLGSDVSDNVEYRMELLTKLTYLSEKEKDFVLQQDYAAKLGIAVFYRYIATNAPKGRGALFETVLMMNDKTKRNTSNLIRNAVCDMLQGFESVDDIVAYKSQLMQCFGYLLQVIMAKEFSVLFKKMSEITAKIGEYAEISDISVRSSDFQKLSGVLRNGVARTQNNPLFSGVYTQWYRIVQTEIKKLAKGAVISLEVETTQCANRGKICCVIQNLGKKPAENITIRAIFEDAVRCKDNEKEIKILYGGDVSVFAFGIRCREEGIQKYKIEVSYEIAQNVEQVDYSHEIRVVKETEYEHIGNLYSVAPVTSNAEFYGREREKEEILSFLNDVKYNTSMVMHGLKRVGKTSMLRFIERTMRDSDIYIPVYKSAQGIGEQNAIGKMFVETIIDELDNQGLVDDKCRSYLDFNYDTNPEQLYDFYTYLQKSELLGRKKILFMADEIEEIFDMVDDGIINRRFYKVLRVILQELTSIRFIFCGADHLTDILYNHALADVFEITKRVIISRLDEEAMQRMIVEPATDKLSYTKRAIERIWYYTKGHTFYSKHICSKVIDILNEESRATAFAYDIDTAVKQVMRVTEYFIYLSRFFSENDRQVIRLMCENIKYSKDRVSLDRLEELYEGRGLTDSLTGLEFKDILEKKEGYDTDFYNFSIEMFRLWYSKAEYVTENVKEEE